MSKLPLLTCSVTTCELRPRPSVVFSLITVIGPNILWALRAGTRKTLGPAIVSLYECRPDTSSPGRIKLLIRITNG